MDWETLYIANIPNDMNVASLNERPHIPIKIGNVNIRALVDGGADISAVRANIVAQLGNFIRPASAPALPLIQDAQKRPLSITGYYEATFQGPNGLCVNFPFYAVHDLQSECILGWDFQRYTGMITNAQDSSVSIGAPTGKLCSVSHGPTSSMTAVTTDLTQLQANSSQMVSLAISLPPDVLLRPGSEVILLSQPGDYSVLDSIVKVEQNNRVSVPVANYTCNDVWLKKGFALPTTEIFRADDLSLKPSSHVSEISSRMSKSSRGQGRDPKVARPPLTESKKQYLLANLDLEGIPRELRDLYVRFVLANHDIFSASKYQLGHCKTVQHRINLRDNEPIYVPQFKIPHHYESTILAHVQEWLRCGVIRKCRSPYNSPIFCVEKPGGGLRVVQDLRRINRHSLDDKYCIRDARECIDTVGRAKSAIFNTLDFKGAFWQMSLHEDSQLATAFTLPFTNTQYCWTRAPMGAKGAPASFSRLMGEVFNGVPNMTTYVDDGLYHARDHYANLRGLNLEVAPRCREHGLLLNIEKCFFGRAEVDYLGFRITPAGVSPSKSKVEALTKLKPPTSLEGLAEHLGFFNYFRHMIGQPNFSQLTYPLRALNRKASQWSGGTLPPAAMSAWQNIIKALCSGVVMAYPDPARPYIVSTDAALGDEQTEGGLGAVLTQESESGDERVVAYWSRQLRDHEKNYSAYGIELKSICDALDHWHEYVYGSKVIVRCDQKPLEAASKVHQKTLTRLTDLMNQYDLEIKYRPGAQNSGPDFLSRNALAAMASDPLNNLTEAQQRDPFAAAIRKFLSLKTLPPDRELAQLVAFYAPRCFDDGQQLWLIDSRRGQHAKSRLIAPAVLVPEIVSNAHGTALSGHWSVERTVERCLNDFFWPTMALDVANFIKRCRRCQESKDRNAKSCLTPLRPWPQALGPNTRVHCDLVGPLKSRGENRHVLVLTCAYSKWVELAAIPNKEAPTVATKIFHIWICRWSVMELLVVDGGKEFANKVLAELLRLLGASRHVLSPLHPRAAGQVERFNREMKAYLTSFVDNDTLDWEDYLPALMFASNTAVNRSTHHTPFYLRTLQDPTFPWSAPRPQPTHPAVARMFDTLVRSREIVSRNNEAARHAYAKYHDKRTKERAFQKGDKVLIHYPNHIPGTNAKLHRPWKGPYQILEVHDLDTVSVRHVSDGKVQRVHKDRVKLFHEFEDPSSQAVEPSPTRPCPTQERITQSIQPLPVLQPLPDLRTLTLTNPLPPPPAASPHLPSGDGSAPPSGDSSAPPSGDDAAPLSAQGSAQSSGPSAPIATESSSHADATTSPPAVSADELTPQQSETYITRSGRLSRAPTKLGQSP